MIRIPQAFLLFLLLAPVVYGQTPSPDQLFLDTTSLYLPCRNPLPAKYRTCPEGMIINVELKRQGRTRKSLRYEYLVSGGHIVGKGLKVVWDLSTARPGIYQITARILNGSTEISKSVTQNVQVKECPECNADCLGCPDISIRGSNKSVRPGDVISLRTAEVVYFHLEWTVIGGEIIEGQGTDRITVRIHEKLKVKNISIRVKVIAEEFCFDIGGCPAQAELEILVETPIDSSKISQTRRGTLQ